LVHYQKRYYELCASLLLST